MNIITILLHKSHRHIVQVYKYMEIGEYATKNDFIAIHTNKYYAQELTAKEHRKDYNLLKQCSK